MSTAIFYPLLACFRVLASAFGSHRLIVNGASLSPTEIDTMKSFCFRFSLLGKQRSTREATFLLTKRICSDSLESVAKMFRAFSHNASVQINIFLAIKRLLVRQISQRRQQQLFFSFHITTHESFMGIA